MVRGFIHTRCIEETHMKKIIFPVFIAVALAGCSHNGAAPKPPAPAKASPPPAISKAIPKPPSPAKAAPPPESSGAVAAPTASTAAALPGTLATLVKLHKVSVEKTFATKAPGITGYLVKQNGQYTVLYGSGGYLLAGALIAPDGRNLTADYKAQYAPQPDYTGLVKKIKADPSVFTVGHGGPILYAFEDPNCIFCHKLDEQTAPLIKAGKLRIKEVLVAFLKADSAGRAAAILGAKDRAKAMAENEAKYDASQEEGGYPAITNPGPNVMNTLKRHMKWMEQAGSSGTPTLIYKTAKGKWTARSGDPGAAWLARYASAGHG